MSIISPFVKTVLSLQMGLTKQYLRFAACGVFNVIGSSSANVVFIEFKGIKGKLCAVGSCEHVFIWDLRKGEKVAFVLDSICGLTCSFGKHLIVRKGIHAHVLFI